MAKIKFSTLPVCLLLLQAVSFTAKAQCSNVSLSAAATPASCYANGIITATVSGADVGNLRLSDAEFRLLPNPAGAVVDWTKWAGIGTTKTYGTAVSGVYRLEMRAFCQVSQDWTTQEIAANVSVGGDYTPMAFSAAMSRKSMNCKPTGAITMSMGGGKPPYRITIADAPNDYAGQLSFTTSLPTLTLDNVPPGSYAATATDACDYTVSQTLTVTTLANDVPNTLSSNMFRASGASDCQSVIPQSMNTVSDPDEQYYWNRSASYYEYAYLTNETDTKNWLALPADKCPVFELPNHYKDFCALGNPLVSYIRPTGCETERSFTHNLSYVCSPDVFIISTLSGNGCNKAKLSLDIPDYYGLCYPANWKIAATATPGLIIDSGTLTAGGNISGVVTSKEYDRGVGYTITLTDKDGKVFTYLWTPPTSGQILYSIVSYPNGYPCQGYESHYLVGSSFMYLCVPSNEYILPGTVIKYVSGPQALGMGSAGSTYTIPAGYNVGYFYITGVAPYTELNYPSSIWAPGVYTFEITPPCGVPYTRTFAKQPNYRVQEITYTTEQTCRGLKVTPTGGLQLADATQTSNLSAYFRILSGPAGVYYSPNYVAQGGELLLPLPGSYRIGMMVPGQESDTGCAIGAIDIVYNQVLSINPDEISSYHCEGNAAGFIRAQAINGIAPYTYTITSAPGTDYIVPQTNATGVFPSIGTAGGTYHIEVKDACRTSFSLPVTMLDLANAKIVYAVNNGTFCEHSEIQINCVTLGQTAYEWTNPGGAVFSDKQRPRPVAVFPESEGTYTVTVTPENCALPVTQSIKINVSPAPPSPNVTNGNIRICQDSDLRDIAILSGTSASSGCSLKWYDSEKSATPIAPPVAHSTGTTKYYVSQQYDGDGCESTRKEITVTVVPTEACCPMGEPTVGFSIASSTTCSATAVSSVLHTNISATETALVATANAGTPAGTLSHTAVSGSGVSITYTPAADDAGKVITITATTNIPDGSLCVPATAIWQIAVTQALSSQLTLNHVACAAASDGEIITNTSGGTAPYRYQLAKPTNASEDSCTPYDLIRPSGLHTFDNLSTGDYQVSVKDRNGCEWTSNAEIVNLDLPEITITEISLKNPTCYGADNGSVFVSYAGQTADYPIVIEVLRNGNVVKSATSNNIIEGLAPGIYDVRVRYAMSSQCVTGNAVKPVEIKAIAPLSISVSDSSEPTCRLSSDGGFTVEVYGWADEHIVKLNDATTIRPTGVDNGVAAFVIGELSGGQYTVSVANECLTEQKDITVHIGQEAADLQLQIVIAETRNAQCGGDGSVRFIIGGGNGAYTYTLNGGEENTTSGEVLQELLPAGDYTISAWQTSDRCAETKTASFSITQPEPLQATLTLKHVACAAASDGEIIIDAKGGKLPYQYRLTIPESEVKSSDANIFDNLSTGDYQVSVIDSNQCEWTSNAEIVAEGLTFFSDTLHVSCFGRRDGEISLSAYQKSRTPDLVEVTDDNRSTVMADNQLPGFAYTWTKADAPDFVFTPQVFPLEEFWGDDYANSIHRGVVGVKNLPVGEYRCEITTNNGLCNFQSPTIPVLKPTYNSIDVLAVNFDEEKANCKIADRRVEIQLRGGWEDYTVFFLDEEDYRKALAGGITYDDLRGGVVEHSDGENLAGEGEGSLYDSENNVPKITYDEASHTTTYRSEILELKSGDYYIVIMDNYGCMTDIEDERFHISIYPKITLSNLNPVNALPCPRDGSGVIQLSATGGEAPYTYSRVYPLDTITASGTHILELGIAGLEEMYPYGNLQKGFYSFLATESGADGCEGFNTFEIKDDKDPVALTKLRQKDASCNGDVDGEVLAMMALGTEPVVWSSTTNRLKVTTVRRTGNYTENYTFKIDDAVIDYNPVAGKDSLQFTHIGVGEHTLVISDTNECSVSLEFEIKEPEALQVNAVTGSEVCGDSQGRLTLNNVSGGTKPYRYSLSRDEAVYQSNSVLKAGGIGNYEVSVKDANGCTASGIGSVRASTVILPEPDFLVSTFGYSSDILAVIDVTPHVEGAVRDSVRFYLDNELICQEDPRIYTYGKYNESDPSYDKEKESGLLPEQIGISDEVIATIVSEETRQQIIKLWNALPTDKEKWTTADMVLDERYQKMKSLDEALQNYQSIYPADVIRRMSFISLKKDAITAKLLAESVEDILLSFNITMKIYYSTGCDTEATKTVYLANDHFEIYPEGKITQKQQDILRLTVIPNPVSRNGDFAVEIEFANRVNFNLSLYDTSGRTIVANQLFNADVIGENMKAVIRREDLVGNVELGSASVVRVETVPANDRAAAIILVKD